LRIFNGGAVCLHGLLSMIEIGDQVVVTGYRLRLPGRADAVHCELLGSIP
jgi:hypothetical protein